MCAAPNSSYLTEKLPLQDVGVVKYDNLLALKLSEYGSNIKSLFYLDALLVAKENGGSKEGFCGLVIVGGANAAMHASTRWSKGRTSPDGGATKYIILNDGGLNTFGKSEITDIISTVFTAVSIDINAISSYYAASNAYGFQYRTYNPVTASWSNWDTINIQPTEGAISAKSSKSVIGVVPNIDSPYPIEVRGYFTNDEGTFTGISMPISTTLVSVMLEDNTTWTANPTAYYIDAPSIITVDNGGAVRLYTNDDLTGKINTNIAKLWIDSRYYYEFGYDVLSDDYVFLTLVDSTPIDPTPTYQEYDAYSSVSMADVVYQLFNNIGTPGILYLNSVDNLWYKEWDLGTGFGDLADDGYYAEGDISGVTGRAFSISSGVLTDE